MALNITITDAGRAEIINANNTGTAPVTLTHIGFTAAAFTPNAGLTALPSEIKRVSSIAGEIVAPDTISVTAKDEGQDTYTMRGFGIFTGSGTLFAVYGQADPIIEKSSGSTMLLTVDVVLADIDAASLEFGDISFSNPPASLTTPGVVTLSNATESTAQHQAATPRAVKSANDNANTRLAKNQNLADLTSAATARVNLGLGTSATLGNTALRNSASTTVLLQAAAMNDHRTSGDHDNRYPQRGNNLSDLPNAIQARSNLGLGSAATRDTQSSSLDTTEGRLLAVAAFGIGGNYSTAPEVVDINALSHNGIYRVSPSNPQAPSNTGVGVLIHLQSSLANNATQMFARAASEDQIWLRNSEFGNWGAWVQLHHSGNQLTLGKTPATGRSALELGAAAGMGTTASRSSTSTSTVLQAKAMNDHRQSDDHDGRYTRRSENLSDLSSPMQARSHLGLGSAATRDQGINDGQLMQVGAFGLGALALPFIDNIDDADARTGIYLFDPTTTGTKPTGYGTLIHTRRLPGRAYQLVFDDSPSNRLHCRVYNAGGQGWYPWQEIHHGGNQLALGTSASSAREALGLGNAAQATVQSSPLDATDNRLLSVAAFGIGGNSSTTPLVTNINGITRNGIYRVSASNPDAPTPTSVGVILHLQSNLASNATQIFTRAAADDQIWLRNSESGGWGPWVQLHHSGNQLALGSSVATARSALGLDNRYLQRASNLGDVSSPLMARNNLGLGNAATKNVGTSSGNLMEVGAFGLGGNNTIGPEISNINALSQNGIYRVSGSPDAPTLTSVGVLMHLQSNLAGNATQIFTRAAAQNQIWMRNKEEGVWGAWVAIFHEGNLAEAFPRSLGINGHCTLPGGWIQQSGQVSLDALAGTAQSRVVNLPTAFLNGMSGLAFAMLSDTPQDLRISYEPINNGSFRMYLYSTVNVTNQVCKYIATGW